MNAATAPTPHRPAQPWWRFGIVWLVLALPASSVVAGLLVAWIAVTHPDPVLVESRAPAATDQEASHSPALKARNHAATPRQP